MESKHELIIPNDHFPFKIFLFEGKDGNYKRASHWHRSVEIFLVVEGFIQFHIHSQEYCLECGDFIIVNSNEVHSIEAPIPNRTLVLQIPMDAFDDYMEHQSYLVFEKQSPQLNRELVDLMIQMYQKCEEKSYAYELQVNGWFQLLQYQLLTYFQRRGMEPEVLAQKKHLDQLSGITDYMKRHYKESLSLEKVADKFGFSPTYLSRIFKRYANINYRTYLQDLRVEYAVRELVSTEHEIGDIAMNHGFADSRAFAKTFKKRYGCLPSEYRKKL